MSKAVEKENKMAVMPVRKLMLNMGVPMIISMMLQAVYNIVDSAFVANMGENGEAALNALTLAFPVQMLMVAIGIGTGVGVNSLLAKSMGQGDNEKASKTAGNGVFLMAAIIAQALMSAMTYLLNVIFVRIGENVVTAYGLYYKVQQFILFAAFGLRDAITPIVSFNYGMENKELMKDGVKYGLWYTLFIMLLGFLGLELFAVPFSGIYGLSGETKELCVSAMRVISVSYVFAGANIAFQGIFQALDGGLESLIISVCRQFLFVIPLAYAFSEVVISGQSGTWLVWVSFIITEAASAVVSVFFMKKISKNKITTI